jgi:hypothetical protein
MKAKPVEKLDSRGRPYTGNKSKSIIQQVWAEMEAEGAVQ